MKGKETTNYNYLLSTPNCNWKGKNILPLKQVPFFPLLTCSLFRTDRGAFSGKGICCCNAIKQSTFFSSCCNLESNCSPLHVQSLDIKAVEYLLLPLKCPGRFTEGITFSHDGGGMDPHGAVEGILWLGEEFCISRKDTGGGHGVIVILSLWYGVVTIEGGMDSSRRMIVEGWIANQGFLLPLLLNVLQSLWLLPQFLGNSILKDVSNRQNIFLYNKV